jgi:hypothetical protein
MILGETLWDRETWWYLVITSNFHETFVRLDDTLYTVVPAYIKAKYFLGLLSTPVGMAEHSSCTLGAAVQVQCSMFNAQHSLDPSHPYLLISTTPPVYIVIVALRYAIEGIRVVVSGGCSSRLPGSWRSSMYVKQYIIFWSTDNLFLMSVTALRCPWSRYIACPFTPGCQNHIPKVLFVQERSVPAHKGLLFRSVCSFFYLVLSIHNVYTI